MDRNPRGSPQPNPARKKISLDFLLRGRQAPVADQPRAEPNQQPPTMAPIPALSTLAEAATYSSQPPQLPPPSFQAHQPLPHHQPQHHQQQQHFTQPVHLPQMRYATQTHVPDVNMTPSQTLPTPMHLPSVSQSFPDNTAAQPPGVQLSPLLASTATATNRSGRLGRQRRLSGPGSGRNRSSSVGSGARGGLTKSTGQREQSPVRSSALEKRRRVPRSGTAPPGRLAGLSTAAQIMREQQAAGQLVQPSRAETVDEGTGGSRGSDSMSSARSGSPPEETEGGKSGLSHDEKRERRRLKNRESAQRSRARRMVKLDNLEKQVSELETENKQLRIEMQSMERRNTQQTPVQYFTVSDELFRMTGRRQITGEEAASLLNQLAMNPPGPPPR